jgi:hypothetical protein
MAKIILFITHPVIGTSCVHDTFKYVGFADPAEIRSNIALRPRNICELGKNYAQQDSTLHLVVLKECLFYCAAYDEDKDALLRTPNSADLKLREMFDRNRRTLKSALVL